MIDYENPVAGRDLDPATEARIRAAVEAGRAGPRRRRATPYLVAAAVAALAASGAVVASTIGNRHEPSLSTTQLASRCLASIHDPAVNDMSVVNTRAVPDGYIVIAKDKHNVAICAVDKHGTRIGSSEIGDPPPAAFVDRTADGPLLQLRTNTVYPMLSQYPDNHRISVGWTTGLAGPNVAYVVLTWPGGYHVSATTRGGTYGVSLRNIPASRFPYAPQIAGYDSTGRRVALWKP